jgi:two-component system LytT family sensor kinase
MKLFPHYIAQHVFRIRTQTKLHFLLLFSWFIPLLTFWVVGPRYLTEPFVFIASTALNFSIAGACLLTLDYFTQRIIRRYPDLNQTKMRAGWLLIAFMLVTPVFILGGIFLYDHFHLFGYIHNPTITTQIIILNIGANLLSVGIDETVYSINKWQENALEKEKLQQENLQSQFESLKSQVNPHFLFNSLNSLSSLIADEPEQAEIFVDEMAKVYRYLLQTNAEGDLTSLSTELQFIESYFHLLKTRYRNGIHLKINLPEDYLTLAIPPLTLQLLIENAVKHNVIVASRPLRLEITGLDGKMIQVRNNLQRKTTRVVSNQIGLNNIMAKYQLLTPIKPVISDDDGYFTVVLPLLEVTKNERTHC